MTDAPDVLVIGAGPAGLASAVEARRRGATVLVVDTLGRPGGQIWRQGPGHRLRGEARRWVGRLEQSGALFLGGHTVSAITGEGRLLAEPVAGASPTPLPVRALRPRATVLATGARELFLPFPGWTLPGVVGVGGAQALVKSGGALKGRRAVVAGTGPLLLEAAATLRHAGVRVSAILEQAPWPRVARFATGLWRRPGKLVQAIRLRSSLVRTPYRTGGWVAETRLLDDVHHVTVTDGSGEWTLECDLLCVGFGLLPETRLARLLGCDVDPDGRLTVDESLHTTVAGLFAAGESTGVGGADLALVEGALAGAGAAAYALDEAPESEHTPPSDSWGPGDRGTQSADEALTQERRSQGAFADAMHRAFALREELRHLAADDTLVCRCEDVPYGALDPAGTARQAKLGTRLGMGPCQGRVCGPATEFMFGWKEEPPRPPIHPMRIESLLLDPPSPHSNGSS